jgi:hypothetical protein
MNTMGFRMFWTIAGRGKLGDGLGVVGRIMIVKLENG